MDTTPKPREPLTTKRRAAIIAYVARRTLRTQRNSIADIVEFTLTAEKMKPEKLYSGLEYNGYTWNPELERFTR